MKSFGGASPLRFRPTYALANVGHPSSSRFIDDALESKSVEICGIPHLAKNERDTPNFLHAALDKIACAPFFKERRMKFAEPTNLHKKSGIWGTRGSVEGIESGDDREEEPSGSVEGIESGVHRTERP
jgi:hypothetical protein